MTVTTSFDSAPQVCISQTEKGFVLRNERNTMVSGFLRGKSIVFAKTLLTSLMGLCPVAHREAFDAAVFGRASDQSSLRIATEAMLESVRVFCVDWQRFVPTVSIREETLQVLGQLRQRLFDVLSNRDEKQTERLFVDTQRFVRKFQITYAELLDALRNVVKPFAMLTPIKTTTLLTPSQWRAHGFLDEILQALVQNRDFAVCPTCQGCRLPGTFARASDAGYLSETLTPDAMTLMRWQELTSWSREDRLALSLFEPAVSSLNNGWRLATVETLRGTLLHAVRSNGAIVDDIHIVAPTEWAFQNQGPLLEAVNEFAIKSGLHGQSLSTEVRLLVALFDACTDVLVTVGDTHA